MARLSPREKEEMDEFPKNERFLFCDIDREEERLLILHSLKDKGYLRFKGNQDNYQFFELVK